ncbi:SAM-dependent methyltransferase [Pseudobacteriovorax antillogorgiicola]|nr:SAM-dependent methyltransferase [Pseudobacteriovorax antillogorgiicola]
MRPFKPYIPDNTPPFPDISADNAIDIEIGCGVGLHPILYCQGNPNRQLIAIEHTREKFDKFARRAAQHKLPNLYPIHANAISFIGKYGRKESVDRFLLMYPNPNPKPSQLNKRWHGMPFMGFLWNCLKPGGSITIVTNESWYKEEALEHFERVWNFPVPNVKAISLDSHPDWRSRTHFEAKYLKRGETCYDICLHKPLA